MVFPYQENPLPSFESEKDEFQFHYTASERPHIQNDMITIHHRFAADHLIKLSISHALSQSTKLCVFEERVLEIVASTKDLPEILASTGWHLGPRLQLCRFLGFRGLVKTPKATPCSEVGLQGLTDHNVCHLILVSCQMLYDLMSTAARTTSSTCNHTAAFKS